MDFSKWVKIRKIGASWRPKIEGYGIRRDFGQEGKKSGLCFTFKLERPRCDAPPEGRKKHKLLLGFVPKLEKSTLGGTLGGSKLGIKSWHRGTPSGNGPA